jgi:hypothetical protein
VSAREPLTGTAAPLALVTTSAAAGTVDAGSPTEAEESLLVGALPLFASPELLDAASSLITSKYTDLMTSQNMYERRLKWLSSQVRTLRVRRAKLRGLRVGEKNGWAQEFKVHNMRLVMATQHLGPAGFHAGKVAAGPGPLLRATEAHEHDNVSINGQNEGDSPSLHGGGTRRGSDHSTLSASVPGVIDTVALSTNTDNIFGSLETAFVPLTKDSCGENFVPLVDSVSGESTRASVRVTHHPGGNSSISFGDPSVGVFAASDEPDRPSVRVAHEPGGKSAMQSSLNSEPEHGEMELRRRGKSSIRINHPSGGTSTTDLSHDIIHLHEGIELPSGILLETERNPVRGTHELSGGNSVSDVNEQSRSSARVMFPPGGMSSVTFSEHAIGDVTALSEPGKPSASAAHGSKGTNTTLPSTLDVAPEAIEQKGLHGHGKSSIRVNHPSGGASTIDLSHSAVPGVHGRERRSVRVAQHPGGTSTVGVTDGHEVKIYDATLDSEEARLFGTGARDELKGTITENETDYGNVEPTGPRDSNTSDSDTESGSVGEVTSNISVTDDESDARVSYSGLKDDIKIQRPVNKSEEGGPDPEPVSSSSLSAIDQYFEDSHASNARYQERAKTLATLSASLMDLACKRQLLQRKSDALLMCPAAAIQSVIKRSLLSLLSWQCKLIDQALLLVMLMPQSQSNDSQPTASLEVPWLPASLHPYMLASSFPLQQSGFGNTLMAHISAVHDLFLLSPKSNFVCNFASAIVDLGTNDETAIYGKRDKFCVDALLRLQQQQQQVNSPKRSLAKTKLKYLLSNNDGTFCAPDGIHEADFAAHGGYWSERQVSRAHRQAVQLSVVGYFTCSQNSTFYISSHNDINPGFQESKFLANTIFSCVGLQRIQLRYNECPWPINILLGCNSGNSEQKNGDSSGLLNNIIVLSTRRLAELYHCVACIKLVFSSLNDQRREDTEMNERVTSAPIGRGKLATHQTVKPSRLHRQRFDKYVSAHGRDGTATASHVRAKFIERQRQAACVYHIQHIVNACLAYAFDRITVCRERLQANLCSGAADAGIAGVAVCLNEYANRLAASMFVVNDKGNGSSGIGVDEIQQGINALLNWCRSCLYALYECSSVNLQAVQMSSTVPRKNEPAKVVDEDDDKIMLLQTLEQRSCYYERLLVQSVTGLQRSKEQLLQALSLATPQQAEDAGVLMTYLGQIQS